MAQKKSKERPEEPLGTMSYQTSSKRSPPFWLLIGARKLVFFWHQSEARTAATVWNWSGKTLSPGALLAVLYFSSCLIFPRRLDFPSPPLSAPGSPRMQIYNLYSKITSCKGETPKLVAYEPNTRDVPDVRKKAILHGRVKFNK